MDDISTNALFVILGVLILISGYFSSSETGIMSINRYRLRHLVKENNKSAKRVDKLLQRPDRLIGLILLGNNLVNIAASSVATLIGLRLFGDAGLIISTLVLTLVILIFAEVTPKTLAALYPEKVAFPSSLILKILLKFLFPFVSTINFITNGILKLFGVSPEQIEEHSLSKEELKTVVNESSAMLPTNHGNMLTSILDLEQVTVEDIMIPRNEINAIDINDDWKDISRRLTNAQHTRVLLYRDQIDDAVGFIHSRDALRLLTKEQFDKPSLLRAVREIYFIPEGTSLNTQLLKFQQNKERIGLVVDEYGDIQGLVTLEDILEEVVGDFTTTQTPTPSDEVTVQSDGSVLVDGSANIRDLNKEMGWALPTEGPKTLSGLIVEYLEDIPESQLSLKIANYPMEVIEVKENMIKIVKIFPLQQKPQKHA
ncbi:HlyC/CorC family transporter [Pseudoalteromonas luteoviolacea]|uniref:Membrane protein n=1 Tax=Pseudoalteromonas luteoviolacea S4054 TaxID=1129367 RepID=A0A0F6AI32_9GAMM|nr:CNNM domain-containing protein [Pseudoalteromonas luteoviolacea]AOT09234.1 magnesium/cobalt efflux protein [Pseudoalteromonas luteoviolacea]AOT14146.1 magnesium/cobalt efflux protein [Pseudoalteromonas luteoviolacea]AOT19062.1 magnesium/cobalt efflux protein [Pseudoalteromonas luteoviolacea]KKE85059.1 membrane protein [Pseudoalteromonas luteoviolacea S4054]KZN70177.1 membrane protein [Pseudoalteromonas luteoviolacea S4047-1]